MPHSVLAASPQRYVRARKRRHAHVPRRSTIARLRSGASVSRAGAFRIGPFRCGGDAARVGTFAFSRPLRSSLRAAPWGHFASLVRSIAAQSARLPSESFAFFGAFTRNRLSPRCAMHPPLRCAWLGRDTSLRQSPPSRRRLSHPGGGLRSGPAPPSRPLDTLIDARFHSGASVPLAPAREPCPRSAQHLAPGGPRPIAAAVVGCNGREGPRPSQLVICLDRRAM